MNTPKDSPQDRRAHARHPIRTEARVSLPDGRVLAVQTLDIGKGGAAVVADINPAVGTLLRVQMRLPARPRGSALFEATASVANSVLDGREGGFRIGLKFGPLDAAAQAALKGMLGG